MGNETGDSAFVLGRIGAILKDLERVRADLLALSEYISLGIDPKAEAHSLKENFRHKQPYAFVLQQGVFKHVTTWRNLYERVLRVLQEEDPKRFAELLENQEFTDRRGKPYFARSREPFIRASKLADNIYAEVTLGANEIRDRIRHLLKTFEIPQEDMIVYLRK